jgi:hypothetical protein
MNDQDTPAAPKGRVRAAPGTAVGAIKQAVRERDGMRCTLCGMTNEEHKARYGGKSLHVHRKEPGGPYTVDGCITLCHACHGPQPKKPRGAPRPEGAPEGQVVAFRVSRQTCEALERASCKYGMTKTAILEALIGLLGEGSLTIHVD